MRWTKTLTMVEAHAEGEVGRVVTGGVLTVPGETMLEKMNYLNDVDDSLRRFCVFEPRGSAQMSTNLLFPPSRPDADAGFIILQGDRAHAMSGSNCICVVTVLLETGIVPMTEPETVVKLDTPAGLVTARALCHDGKCERVVLDMVPGFVEHLDYRIDVPGLDPVTVDIAFGGVYYALIDPKQFGRVIEPDQARALVDIGSRVHRALNETVLLNHPTEPSLNTISYTMFVDQREDGALIGGTVLPPGRFDRSPCGTGNTARMAVRHARGEVSVGDKVEACSIIGSRFNAELIGETRVGDRPATLTRLSGRGWIHGLHQIGVDPTDPYPQGFLLSDTWGDAFDLLL
ncbi:proline racemase family protein [Coralliovum pocilloporae]|uniref:proline racemase family protein n=1 Tax=Coralliovum pocilloporae TaxID=3066369 RepID=UPI003306FBE6